MKRLFIVLTWVAVLALPAAAASQCFVNCCAMRAMPRCDAMAKTLAAKPLTENAPRVIVTTFAPFIVPTPIELPAPPAVRADLDIGIAVAPPVLRI